MKKRQNWSYAATQQGMPKATRNWKYKKEFSTTELEGAQPY